MNVKSPYRGLSAFEDSELDALYFFGRERDSEIVVANLIAARLTVLYGPSGVGKSSLLLASVARTLRALPEEPRPIEVPNTYATELALERRTILLRLHGAVDPFPDRAWESFVITEDDYIEYLGRSDLVSAVPVALAAHLRRSHFLFVGYEMVDWNLRLVMHRVWGDRPLAYRSWALDPEPTALDSAFWRRFDVDVLDVDPDEYVGLLERRLEGVA